MDNFNSLKYISKPIARINSRYNKVYYKSTLYDFLDLDEAGYQSSDYLILNMMSRIPNLKSYYYCRGKRYENSNKLKLSKIIYRNETKKTTLFRICKYRSNCIDVDRKEE